jgi:hypothetical protein
LFLNELLDEKSLDGSPGIATASLDQGRDIRFRRIGVTMWLFLFSHRNLLWRSQWYGLVPWVRHRIVPCLFYGCGMRGYPLMGG